MVCGDFRDHLPVVCSRTEHLRVERNGRDWLTFNGLGEFVEIDLRPLGHSDLIEAVQRDPVVRPRCLQQVKDILGVAQVGQVRRGDDQDIVRTDQSAFGPARPLVRNVQHDARHGRAKRVEDESNASAPKS